ncbi:hypothetical protein [Methylorubrum extorquens]
MINACTFLGGSFGVASGAILYSLAGFAGVMSLVAAAALLGAALERFRFGLIRLGEVHRALTG